MQQDIKKGVSIEGKHFIFKVGWTHQFNTKPLPLLLRTGVKWQSLLGTLISVPELKKAFGEDWAKVWERYPQLRNNHRYRSVNGQLIPIYNYIAPEQGWINEFPVKRASLIQNLIPRFRRLLVEQVLPYWIVVQIIPPLLDVIAKTFSEEDAIDLGQRFLKATIEVFQSTRQTVSGDYKFENFYSFVLNLLQQSFLSNNYAILVCKTLVAYRMPVSFLKLYALYPNNNATREGLWQWFLEDQDFFGKKFDKYWLARQYQKSEIESFKDAVIPVISPDEYDEYEDMLEQDILEQKEWPLQTPVSVPFRYPEIYSTPVTVPISSPADSLISNSSSSSYFYPPSPVYFVPDFRLTPAYVVSSYPVSMQFLPNPSGADYMMEQVPSLLGLSTPQMGFTSIEESKSNRISTTILESMRTPYSTNQQGFLVSRNTVQDRPVVKSDYNQYRH